MLSAFDNFPALLIWLPVIGGLVSFFVKGEGRVRTWAMLSTILTLVVMGVSLLYTDDRHYMLNMVSYVWLNSLGASFALALDGLSRTLCLLTAVSFPLIVAVASRNRYEQPNAFYGLLLLSQAGLMGVFMAADALTFYFFWELALIPVYFLASRWGGERRIQTTFKFFIYTFIGSLLLLVGILYVHTKTSGQSFALGAFYSAALTKAEQGWLFWLFFLAFAIKMPIFPFHTWQPDAYEQSATPVTMLLSGIMVKMGVLAVMRWLLPVFPAVIPDVDNIVIGLSVVGIVYASCIAWVQDDLKRLVAYSSIAHVGLMAAALFTLRAEAWQGVVVQMFNHGVNIIGLWMVVEMIERETGVRRISQLGGIAHKAPVLTAMLVIVALANVALPLTNAFVGEFLMLNGLYRFNPWYAAFAGLGVVLSAVYTLNMIRRVFLGQTNGVTAGFREIPVDQRIVLAVVVVLVFMVGVMPGPMLEMAEKSTEVLLKKIQAK
jgi:NADH-quinone oxidoreductase subunit M